MRTAVTRQTPTVVSHAILESGTWRILATRHDERPVAPIGAGTTQRDERSRARGHPARRAGSTGGVRTPAPDGAEAEALLDAAEAMVDATAARAESRK